MSDFDEKLTRITNKPIVNLTKTDIALLYDRGYIECGELYDNNNFTYDIAVVLLNAEKLNQLDIPVILTYTFGYNCYKDVRKLVLDNWILVKEGLCKLINDKISTLLQFIRIDRF